MITSRNSTRGHVVAPLASFESAGAEKDAAAWANLLDDWLGPENDVYARLLQRSGSEKHTSGPSS